MRSGAIRRTIIAAALATGAFWAPAAAEASTAGVVDGVVTVRETASEINDIEVSFDGSDILVSDTAGVVAQGPGCIPDSPTRARCGLYNFVEIDTGTRRDRVVVAASLPAQTFVETNLGAGADRYRGGAGADFIHGESGGDRLRGGAGDDQIYGERGRDRMFGGLGFDTIHARDDRRDRRIHCGPGANDQERAIRDRGVDPRAISC